MGEKRSCRAMSLQNNITSSIIKCINANHVHKLPLIGTYSIIQSRLCSTLALIAFMKQTNIQTKTLLLVAVTRKAAQLVVVYCASMCIMFAYVRVFH